VRDHVGLDLPDQLKPIRLPVAADRHPAALTVTPCAAADEAKAFEHDAPISLQAGHDTPSRVELMFDSGYSCRP
jgi:hypothetical protein